MKQKPKKYFLISLIIGLFVMIIGVALLVSALSMEVPAFGEEGWFEGGSEQDKKTFIAIGVMIVGFIIAVGVSLFVYEMDPVVKKRRMKEDIIERKMQIGDFEGASRLIDEDDVSQSSTPLSNSTSGSSSASVAKTCAYCGSEIPKSKNECPFCGAKQQKK